MYLLAVNCGSSSIKGKLYAIPPVKSDALKAEAQLGVSNISSKGEKVKIKVEWTGSQGKDVNEEGDDGDKVECMYTFQRGRERLRVHLRWRSDAHAPGQTDRFCFYEEV